MFPRHLLARVLRLDVLGRDVDMGDRQETARRGHRAVEAERSVRALIVGHEMQQGDQQQLDRLACGNPLPVLPTSDGRDVNADPVHLKETQYFH